MKSNRRSEQEIRTGDQNRRSEQEITTGDQKIKSFKFSWSPDLL
jgi:hypothetical protein